jgi:hypothetical protein
MGQGRLLAEVSHRKREVVVGVGLVNCDAELPPEIAKARRALDDSRAVWQSSDRNGDEPRPLFLNVTHDLLDHVLDRHQPLHAAVLVDDDRQLLATSLELAQQSTDARSFRDEEGWPSQG